MGQFSRIINGQYSRLFYNPYQAANPTSHPPNLKNTTIYNIIMATIDIVMAYYKRIDQLTHTLESIRKSKYDPSKITIIIIDDCSEDGIENHISGVKLVHITRAEKGDRRNPCIPFNLGFSMCKSDIVIIQNPEAYHYTDIISYVGENLKPSTYMVFDTFNNVNNDHFYKTGSPQGNNWFHHHIHNPKWYHFCSAIYRKDLEMLGGFDRNFSLGYCFDDDDLLFRIRDCMKLDIVNGGDNMVVNLYHEPAISTNCNIYDMTNPITQKWHINRTYYESKKNSINPNFIYPRILHLYWVGKLSYTNLATVLSFRKYHPAWIINVYTTTLVNMNATWESKEHKEVYEFEDCFGKLYDIPGVNVIECEEVVRELGIEGLSYVYQSDIIRSYMLHKYGGVWSDFDILYIRNIEEELGKFSKDILFQCYFPVYLYYPIGFFVSKGEGRGGEIFGLWLKEQLKGLKDATTGSSYQKFGSELLQKVLNNYSGVPFDGPGFGSGYPIYNDKIELLGNEYYLPYQAEEINLLFGNNYLDKITDKTIGIHWFNGANITKKYLNNPSPCPFTTLLSAHV